MTGVPAGKGVRRRVQLHQQRVHGHPAEQMVQRPAVCGPRAGDVRPRAAHAAGRRRLPGRVPHAGLRHPGRRRHPVPGARFLPLRAAQAPADAARLGVAEPEHHVRQPSACHPPRASLLSIVFGPSSARKPPENGFDLFSPGGGTILSQRGHKSYNFPPEMFLKLKESSENIRTVITVCIKNCTLFFICQPVSVNGKSKSTE